MDASDAKPGQRYDPHIYLAGHSGHIRASSTRYRLSARDSSILVHLDVPVPVSPTKLAAHLSVRASTLSAAIHRLEELGHLQRKQMPRDRRTVALTLMQEAPQARAETSGLDSARVEAVLARLKPSELRQALEGLELLARASRQTMSKRDSKEQPTC